MAAVYDLRLGPSVGLCGFLCAPHLPLAVPLGFVVLSPVLPLPTFLQFRLHHRLKCLAFLLVREIQPDLSFVPFECVKV